MLDGEVGLGDIDGDGDPDAIIGLGDNTGSALTIVLLNDGSGRFSDSGQRLDKTRWASFGFADLNNDGHIDIFVSNFMRPNQVWVNDVTGQFIDADIGLGGSIESIRVSVGDLDVNGDDDILFPILREGKMRFGSIHLSPNNDFM